MTRPRLRLERDRLDGSRRHLLLGLSTGGAVVSFFLNLYMDNVREAVEWTWSRFAVQGVLFALVVVLCCYGTWTLRGWLLNRRLERQRVMERAIQFRTEDFDEDLPPGTPVIGRRLRYLERVTDSPYLIVCLHGLGLDANDFRQFMQVARQHTAAITLFGFNSDEANDPRYRPIGLEMHARLVSGVIHRLQRQYPRKQIIVVGFSLGADMQLRLAELWRANPDLRPRIAGMLLLDPNINHSTMVVSGGVATLDASDPLTAFKRIADLPTSLVEFQNICEYLHKITTKDLAQVRQFAADMLAYWEPDGHYDLFLGRIADLQKVSARVRVVFSMHYEDHFNDIVANARQRQINRELFVVEEVDHFDLLRDTLLARELSIMTGDRPARPRIR